MSRRTHCRRGHSMADAVVRPTGNRQCAQCKRDRENARYHGIVIPDKLPRVAWDTESTEILVRMYPDHSAKEIAGVLGCGRDRVLKKGQSMRLKKSEDFHRGNQHRSKSAVLGAPKIDIPVFTSEFSGRLPACPSISDLLKSLRGSMAQDDTKRKYERRS